MDNGGDLTMVEMNNIGQRTMVDNAQWWTMDNGGQWAMVDNEQWWTVDDGGQWTMVDIGQ